MSEAVQRCDAGLLVVGTRGSGGFSGLRLGSVALKLLQNAVVPIVVVPRANDVAGPAIYYRLGNLTAIIDVNRLGQRGPTELEWDLDRLPP